MFVSVAALHVQTFVRTTKVHLFCDVSDGCTDRLIDAVSLFLLRENVYVIVLTLKSIY